MGKGQEEGEKREVATGSFRETLIIFGITLAAGPLEVFKEVGGEKINM